MYSHKNTSSLTHCTVDTGRKCNWSTGQKSILIPLSKRKHLFPFHDDDDTNANYFSVFKHRPIMNTDKFLAVVWKQEISQCLWRIYALVSRCLKADDDAVTQRRHLVLERQRDEGKKMSTLFCVTQEILKRFRLWKYFRGVTRQ